MINRLTIGYICRVLGILIGIGLAGSDAGAQILNEDYAAGADVLILRNEMSIFSTIHDGVKLSVAECELFDNCTASVDVEELNQLISTINGRINSLSLRYTDSGEAELEDVLVGYVDIRDNYTAILEKIESMPEFEVEEAPADEFGFDDFFSFGATTNEVSPEIQQLFEDVDEEIEDDNVDFTAEEIPGPEDLQ